MFISTVNNKWYPVFEGLSSVTYPFLKRLYKTLKENEKQKANLFDSLKICDIDSVRRSIFQEIQKLEKEYTNIKTEIAIEKNQCVKTSIPQVKFFLTQMKKVILMTKNIDKCL